MGDSNIIVTWHEKNKTTVVSVDDFERRVVVSNIARADQSFFQARAHSSTCPEGREIGCSPFSDGCSGEISRLRGNPARVERPLRCSSDSAPGPPGAYQ